MFSLQSRGLSQVGGVEDKPSLWTKQAVVPDPSCAAACGSLAEQHALGNRGFRNRPPAMKLGTLSFAAGSGLGVRPSSLLNARDGSAAGGVSAAGLPGGRASSWLVHRGEQLRASGGGPVTSPPAHRRGFRFPFLRQILSQPRLLPRSPPRLVFLCLTPRRVLQQMI